MTSSFDAIVVGGGHNGLVAAHYLSTAGLRTLVLEKRHIIGGACSTMEFFPGYRGSFANSPGSLEPKIVQDMALHSFGLEFIKPDPTVVVPFSDGKRFVGWREKGRMLTELRRHYSERDIRAYYEVFSYFDNFAQALGIDIFAPPPTLSELASRIQTPESEEAFASIILGSVRDFLDARLESEHLKAVITILSVVHNFAGPSTPGTPAMLLQRPMSLLSSTVGGDHDPRRQPLRGSTGLPKGSMGGITEAMAKSLVAGGVEIRRSANVTHIKVSNGAVTGVALDTGMEFSAPLVLSNLNPKTTLLELLPAEDLDTGFRRQVSDLIMRGSAFKVVLALEGLPKFAVAETAEEAEVLSACQFRIAPSMDYMEEAYDDAKYGIPSRGPMIWGLIPTATDPDLSPPGKHLMSVNVWHAPYHLRDGEWDGEQTNAFGQRCVDVLEEHLPGVKALISDYRFFSPLDLERELGLVEGHITHGDMLPGRMYGFRPLPGWSRYRTPISGLYLCGSGTWPGGLVSGAPGHNAAHAALEDKGSPHAFAEGYRVASRDGSPP